MCVCWGDLKGLVRRAGQVGRAVRLPGADAHTLTPTVVLRRTSAAHAMKTDETSA